MTARTLTAACALFALAACSEIDGIDPRTQLKFDQVDRTAIPAVATLFVDPLGTRSETAADPKNRFHAGAPLNAPDFADDIRATLSALRSLDDNPANDAGAAGDTTDPSLPRVSVATTTAVVAPDVLTLDLSGSQPGLLGVELGAPDAFGGRTLAEDVVDAALGAIVFPGAGPAFTSDYADANDATFRDDFPYVAPAN